MNLQPAAVNKLKELVAEEGNPNLMLRVFVQGEDVRDSVTASPLTKSKTKMILILFMTQCKLLWIP
jgi:Fe-S cluster assembly iron-binding protein IscA